MVFIDSEDVFALGITKGDYFGFVSDSGLGCGTLSFLVVFRVYLFSYI